MRGNKGKQRIAWSVLLSGSLVLSSFSGSFADTNANAGPDASNSEYYFIQLEDQPVATYSGGIRGYGATMVGPKQRVCTTSQSVKKYRTFLGNEHSKYKKWLKEKAVSVKIASEYSLAFNGLGVKATAAEAEELAKGPGVVRVFKSKKYYPMMNRSNEIIHAPKAWKNGYTGAGVKVAVIDSGIDQDHPFLQDSELSMPTGFPKVKNEEWKKYTSNKVIVAKVFNADRTMTPQAIGSHGTHVAGTIAGRASYVDPKGRVASPLSGVAPKAYLGNYNVFPGDGGSAESVYIAAAVEEAVNDGMDVANLSLGSAATPGYDLLVEVINGANRAGMSTVISAGNEGPGPRTIGSPGIAESAITVAAVNNSHFLGKFAKVKVGEEEKTVSIGSSDPGGKITEDFSAPLEVITEDNGLGCSPITTDLHGKVAVLKRGTCSFTEKANHAKDKGAAGVVIINNIAGDPMSMKVDEVIGFPVVMVSDLDGSWISSGSSATISFPSTEEKEFESSVTESIADFSSRGPTINYTLKPDVAAVGVSVYSSVVGGDLASFNGTSMSAPHVAGAVALLLQAHPDWTPQDVKSALIATGRNPKGAARPTEVGGGIIDLDRALQPVALCYPASLSFGKLDVASKKTLRVEVKNSSSTFQTYQIKSVHGDFTFNKSSIRLSSGNKGAFTVTIGRSHGKGQYQGYIVLAAKNKSIRIPYHYLVG